MKSALVIVCLAGWIAIAAGAAELREPATPIEFGPQVKLREAFPETGFTEIFGAVSTRVRFEPYAGILRGAEGTALAQAGNALDQSVLLARLLRLQGYEVRFVRGSLTDRNRDVLVRGMYPPDIPAGSSSQEFAPFDAYADPLLRRLVADHYWLEIRQGDSWLPLDPSFPRAAVGEAYGVAEERMAQPGREASVLLAIRYKRQFASGATELVDETEERVADIALRPISLQQVMTPLAEPPAEGENKSPLGAFGGALSGKSAPDTAEPSAATPQPRIVGAAREWRFVVPGRGRTSGKSLVLRQRRDSAIAREWLEFDILSPGMQPRTVTRTLFQANRPGSGPQPPDVSHHTISLFNAPVSQDTVIRQVEEASKALGVASLQKTMQAIEAGAHPSAYSEALSIEERLGSALLHLVNLRFAAESDSLSELGAYRNGIALAYGTPRIVISSLVSGETGYTLAMDLRLDEVMAMPFPGAPSRLAELFQTARGFQNSVLEGKILEHFAGKPAVTTAHLMRNARQQDTRLIAVNARSFPEFMSQADLPEPVASVVRPYLENDGEIIITARPVELAGQRRWGWWAMDPASGRAVGVMEDGGHQAMIENSVNTDKIALNPMTGFVIGGIVGATATHFVIAAKILEYGAVTDEMIGDVEDFLTGLSDASCPGASSTYSASLSFAGCMKIEAKAGVDALAMSFCAKYADGFNCASGLLLGGLKGQPPGVEFKMEHKERWGSDTSTDTPVSSRP